MKLIPKSKKGKERCKRDGSTGWKVIKVSERVQFSDNSGPGWFIENSTPDSSRWIHSINDKDFSWEN